MTDTEQLKKMINATDGVVERELKSFLNGGWDLLDPELANEIGKRVASKMHAVQHNFRVLSKN